MKLVKKSETVTGVKCSEPTISIGLRGTAMVFAKTLPPGCRFGENAQLPKVGKDEATAPWLIVRSWVSPRPKPFALIPLSVAVKKKMVQVLKGVTWTQTATGKVFKGDAFLPKDWEKGQKMPQTVAVIAPGWPSGRVEAKMVNEPNGKPARNRAIVGRFQLK